MGTPSVFRRFFWIYVIGGIVVTFALIFMILRLRIYATSEIAGDVWVVDERGTVLQGSTEAPLPDVWESFDRPDRVPSAVISGNSRLKERYWVFRLSANPARFMVFHPRMSLLGKGFYGLLVTLPILLSLAVLFFGTLILYVRKKGVQAHRVVARLKSGDLKARFHVGKLDEVGRSMQAFNEMADEVERLVEKVREAETRRTQILRELAHDVRTPLTALAYLFETITDPTTSLSAEAIREKAGNAKGELDYLNRLIEDLFLLAESEDHRHQLPRERLDPLDIVETEMERLRPLRPSIQFLLDAEVPEGVWLEANRYLVRRLIGNALENASQFARGRVDVIMQPGQSGLLEILVRDDGPGFTPEALKAFGMRRQARFIDGHQKGKASLGLGSVIMKTVTELHGGRLTAGNWNTDKGAVGGAEIRVLFPVGGALGAKAA